VSLAGARQVVPRNGGNAGRALCAAWPGQTGSAAAAAAASAGRSINSELDTVTVATVAADPGRVTVIPESVTGAGGPGLCRRRRRRRR
jgi:hypothetical protein